MNDGPKLTKNTCGSLDRLRWSPGLRQDGWEGRLRS